MYGINDILTKLALSLAVGGIIGMERELRSKSAGFRTIMLICLGATFFTMFSEEIGAPGNADRIASNVVTGIGFLGAGIIFRTNTNRVNGITTAATIWLSAALGMGIGAGYYLPAVIGCVIVFSILFVFSFFDSFLDRLSQVREYKIVYPYVEKEQHKYEELIEKYGLSIKARAQNKTGNIITGTWTVKGSEKRHHVFIERILQDNEVTDFSF